ncbi:MAG: DUF2283 domain-containing protein [Desulfurococcales archaeon]|nr:DUF2283 domain-containing protein [Desulfurococcales archaeon]MEB3786803.1 DUF2283 domain-containing protein [Desulfurococcales archaeon]MEB3798706.1 DUF2283 domain-containing protein [Desulfurococcales archaeon]MEB3846268.1 DUF2283 domain-containing protein [Desulfurococcales archaeon]
MADIERIWFDYDKQNDILYINFGYNLEEADESIMTENDIVIRIKDNRIVGITVFDFSKRVGGL